MIKRGFNAVAATWLAGLGVLLPLVLTVAALARVFGLANSMLGPGSYVGGLFRAIGETAWRIGSSAWPISASTS